MEPEEIATQPENELWARIANRVYPALVRSLTAAVILALCLWIGAGVINILLALRPIMNASSGWRDVAEDTIINSLVILALLEVIRALQSYLKLGRVRVTFILDAALVVSIGELIGLWFKEYATDKVLLGLGVIITLVALRIVTTGYSPELHSSV